jgi:RNA-directed DNA polymerase
VSQAKPFDISKRVVLEAYKRVKSNRGACGVDGERIQDFERKLKENLYKIWNRMSSGSYFPPAVRRVEIPKASGGKRPLGIPTVSDRIAQMVVKIYLEPKVETYFHRDSYGYRPNKSAIEALEKTRERCWRYDWVLDVDIRGFFENLDHELMMRAVEKHSKCKWILLYVERWLKAAVQEGVNLVPREKGTPQGGVISPLLANMYLHYALDKWMRRNYPDICWERYADDVVYHCKTQEEAMALREAIEKRLAECRLELHPEKTKIVYCKDGKRKREYREKSFDFLGYTFRPRKAKNYRGEYFCNFSPAVSQKAKKQMSRQIRSWHLQRRSGSTLEELSKKINPILRGWVNYYGRYYRSGLCPILRQFDCALMKWAMRKYKRFRSKQRAVANWLKAIAKRSPGLFVHWTMRIV